VTGNPLETKKSVSHSIFEANPRPNCRPDTYGSSIAIPSSSLRRGRATLIAKVGAGQVVIARITLSVDENRSRSHPGNTRAQWCERLAMIARTDAGVLDIKCDW